MSGNTLGVTLWSDAKQEAPMLPNYPDLICCPHCDGLFRASKAQKAEEQPTGWSSPFPSPPDLTEQNWLDAVDEKLFTGKDEVYARMGAWHAANDSRRRESVAYFAFSPRAVANLEALHALFEKSATPNDQLLIGEILREQGRFEESVTALTALADEELARVRDQMRERAQNRDSAPFIIQW